MRGNELKSGGEILIIGAGPAGLTAAVELVRKGYKPLILEADTQVGGISRTVDRNGWKFDLGGHRFFTKVARVEEFWKSILSNDEFPLRPRMSRIFYRGKFFDYPLRAFNALFNLGVFESFRCVLSYLWVRVRPPKNQSNFEGWVAARFGWRLYRIFFKTYTEKVWGISATEIDSAWAAQRIKNLSLAKAIKSALMPKGRNSREVTSLIEQFNYPIYGPGMLWERCADLLEKSGVSIKMEAGVERITRASSGALLIKDATGSEHEASSIISSMPINEIVLCIEPGVPGEIAASARKLKHRDFLTVALVVNEAAAFPDNWIYIHDPAAKVGRIQNFGSWSPEMVKPGFTCLGLEYFVNSDEELWNLPDSELISIATAEVSKLGLAREGSVTEGYVVRVPRAYPVYDSSYQDSLEKIRMFLAQNYPEIIPVGRNGMHRYNNQDHSMLTAMLAVENILTGSTHDLWSVNVEEEYLEEGKENLVGVSGTGRSAPVIK